MNALHLVKPQVGIVKGWFLGTQMDVLWPVLMALPSKPLIVEVGTYCGRATRFFSLARPDAMVLTIDTGGEFPIAASGETAAGETIGDEVLKGGNVFQVIGDSVEIAKRFHWPINALFVDGDHSYKGVKCDIEAWVEHLVVGGVVVFHDYTNLDWPGVARAVDRWFLSQDGFDVAMQDQGLFVARRHSS